MFIQDKSTAIPGPMKDYRYLTEEEHKVKLEEEDNKGKDPCEEDMECMQDKEIRKKVKLVEELNWRPGGTGLAGSTTTEDKKLYGKPN